MKKSVPAAHMSSQLWEPSAHFKKEVFKSILAIAGFILVYIAVFILTLGLVAASIYVGLVLMFTLNLFASLIGGGLIGLGVMVFVFLVKFLFASAPVDASDSIEITEVEQPELVRFIYQIAEEAQTPRPGKILLSSDVNACVFYHSSFWSMFLPVKKNLKLGLGLINGVNKSELKAVIAHEFGHFSQRSMKLGSYTYHVNKIIHDMLYNNSGYGETLSSWSRIHGVFSFFAQLTVQVVRAIQWVLLQVYKVVNKSYLGLSRQMEFHADLVAARVSGSNNMISALYRVELADVCYNATLQVGDQVWKENKVLADVYAGQKTVLKRVADVNKWPLVQGLAVINESHRSDVMSRVSFKDQWASHPTTDERKAYLQPYELVAAVDETPAWALLQDEQTLRLALTQKLYRNLPVTDEMQTLDAAGFDQIYSKQVQDGIFPEIFKGYYDHRTVAAFDTNPNQEQQVNAVSLEDVLTPAALALPKQIEALKLDIEVLKAIADKQIDTRTFDFDGQKYDRSKAVFIQQDLELELKACYEKLIATDAQLYYFSYKTALLEQAEGLRKRYESYLSNREKAERFWEKINAMMQSLQPIYAGHTLQLEEIDLLIAGLKEKGEPALKEGLQEWLAAGAFDSDNGIKRKIEEFLRSQFAYFSGNSFFDNELVLLNEVAQEGWNAIDQHLFHQFKDLLVYQALCLHPLQPIPVKTTVDQVSE